MISKANKTKKRKKSSICVQKISEAENISVIMMNGGAIYYEQLNTRTNVSTVTQHEVLKGHKLSKLNLSYLNLQSYF